ncbi:barstar family protein [Streptomyces anulatus]|uniref:barstar family protein n=1 Tax=Streptomyces anulatus TaxID=1892 RepID=UPI003405DFD1
MEEDGEPPETVTFVRAHQVGRARRKTGRAELQVLDRQGKADRDVRRREGVRRVPARELAARRADRLARVRAERDPLRDRRGGGHRQHRDHHEGRLLLRPGEAVNGPGGYFGSNLDALFDCLRTARRDEAAPFRLVWRNLAASREALGSDFTERVLALFEECGVETELS